MKHKILHWIFERLFRLLRFNPCAHCAFYIDDISDWSDGAPVETISTNNENFVRHIKIEKGDKK